MKRWILAPEYIWDGISEKPEKGVCFLVEDGKISGKGSLKQCRDSAPDAEIICGEYLILPGFTDAHDHGRGISPTGFGVEDAPLEMWLQDLWKIPPISHYTACYYDGIRLASSGVTTVLHSHNPNSFDNMEDEVIAAARGYLDAGVRCILCPLYLDQNKGIYLEREKFIRSLPEDTGRMFRAGIHDKLYEIEEYFALIDRLRERLKKEISDGMVEIQLHPNGGQWCSDEALLKMKEYALSHEMKIHMHLLETKYQAIYAQKQWGCTFIQHYKNIGFLGPWLSCAHMVWINGEDMDLLKEYGVVPVNNPSSNIRLRSGMFPLRELVKRNIPVGLGLDGCAFDDDQDYLREIRTAFYNMETAGAGSIIPNIIPIKMATVWGSRIADGRLSPGILSPGTDADFVCISLKELYRPYADESAGIVDLLLHRGRRETVQAVFVKGIKIYDKDRDVEKVQKAEKKIAEEISDLRKKNPCQNLAWKKDLISRVERFYKGWEKEYEDYCNCTNCVKKKILV